MHLKIQPRFRSTFVLETKAFVLKKLTRVESVTDQSGIFGQFNNLLLADPSYRKASDIDIVLGVVQLTAIIRSGLVKTSPTKPIAQNTELGWIISCPINAKNQPNTFEVVSCVTNFELDEKISNFFKQSEILDSSNQAETNTDIQCEKDFVETHHRDEIGMYVVSMPFKDGLEKLNLGESRKMADLEKIHD